ncbi:MAG: TraR/DksA family transcriptional regulator [Opitutae bacterium]|nr:TraR/DksA family transcriptional regulator [Opitutae bacterium]
MDEIDDAQKAERLFLQDAMDRRTPVGRPGEPSLTHCTDCDEPIPEARRLAVPGCQRCRECQEEYESHFSCKGRI